MKTNPETGETRLWPESLQKIQFEASGDRRINISGKRQLAYAVFLSSVFWSGVLLISHQIW